MSDTSKEERIREMVLRLVDDMEKAGVPVRPSDIGLGAHVRLVRKKIIPNSKEGAWEIKQVINELLGEEYYRAP